ncbi:hypothetical protein Mal4_20550 [Maioricimonas rarisocia]|uniref:Uncharacterized protein n=1 Tax=Maioricimonas rarisocia TaxID=2528026 RepID=A0A517Z5H0_9PLAN|nr:hypothetical protein [Maioricimonas rarisocia]QDU37738.1 hypothetical protein Mal4_20550 [Maioricimonas rarisocia]
MYRNPLLGLVCLAVLATTGCQSLDLFSTMSGRKPLKEATPQQPAIEVLCFWEAAEGRGLDNLPTRGFAGQVLFFTSGNAEPVKVDGDVRVYLFDDQGSAEEQAKPIHQFDFDAQAWETFLRETNVGAAYQLFIPYTRKGVHQAECSIRVRFTPENGLPLYSKMASITLPGKKVVSPTSQTASPEIAATQQPVPQSGVELAAHRDAAPLQPATPQQPVARPNFSQTIRPSNVELASGTNSSGQPGVERRLDRLERMLHTLVDQNQTFSTDRQPPAEFPTSGTQRYRLAPTTQDAASGTAAMPHPLAPQPVSQPAPKPVHPLRQEAGEWMNAESVQESSPTSTAPASAPPRHPLLD